MKACLKHKLGETWRDAMSLFISDIPQTHLLHSLACAEVHGCRYLELFRLMDDPTAPVQFLDEYRQRAKELREYDVNRVYGS